MKQKEWTNSMSNLDCLVGEKRTLCVELGRGEASVLVDHYVPIPARTAPH